MMSAAIPALEALIGIGTFYQFLFDREPVDALEKVSKRLRAKSQKKRVRKRGLWVRFKSLFTGAAPPSRILVREFADEYANGISDREIPLVRIMGESKKKVVFFPEAQHVFSSDRASFGWLILTIGTIGIPIAERVSDPHDRAALVGVWVELVGLVLLGIRSFYREHFLWRSYLAEICRMRGIKEAPKMTSSGEVDPPETWLHGLDADNSSWLAGNRWYPHPGTITSKDDIQDQLDLVDDAITEWEMRENKINSIDAGYWPAAVIALAVLPASNSQIYSWFIKESWWVEVITIAFVLGAIWGVIAAYAHLIIRRNQGNTLPELRKIRRIYRRRLRELDSTAHLL